MLQLTLGASGKILRVASLAAILLSCVSCAHSGTVAPTEADAQQLIGWDIQVTTTDGRVHEFRLLEVTGDALIGESEQVRFDDVASLKWRDAKTAKSPWFWIGVGAGGMLLGILLFLYGLEQSI